MNSIYGNLKTLNCCIAKRTGSIKVAGEQLFSFHQPIDVFCHVLQINASVHENNTSLLMFENLVIKAVNANFVAKTPLQ